MTARYMQHLTWRRFPEALPSYVPTVADLVWVAYGTGEEH